VIISTHTFMFPFVIKDKDSFMDNISKQWDSKKFRFSRVEYYNDFIYFYPYVRDVLFGLNDTISNYYEKNLGDDAKYIITLTNGSKFELEIEDISLRVFNDTIGILSFHLNNKKYKSSDAILQINEYGRRIFPQYLSKNGQNLLQKVKESFLPDSIEIKYKDGYIKEDFNYFQDEERLKTVNPKDINNYLIPKFIKQLINSDIEVILDDRMFVVSFYLDMDGKLLDELKNLDENEEEYSYVSNDWWYQYLFVDNANNKSCQSRFMQKELVKSSTYDRWMEYGTLWGISRYSFVGIGNWDLMMTHTKTIYFQIMTLLLFYRAIIVNFSDEVQNIVEKIKVNGEDKKSIRYESKKLYGEYLKFLNGLYFKEVTAQEQGIELYKKALKIMEVEEYIKDFDREISELDNYIEIEVEKERNEELDKLNKLATIFLPPTLIAGVFGMNVGVFDNAKEFKFLLVFILIIGSVVLSNMIIGKKDLKNVIVDFMEFFKEHKRVSIPLVVIIAMIFAMGIL